MDCSLGIGRIAPETTSTPAGRGCLGLAVVTVILEGNLPDGIVVIPYARDGIAQ